MFKKKTSSPDIDRAVAQGVSFELTLAERARKSERRAWLVAWSAIVMSLILAASPFLTLMLAAGVVGRGAERAAAHAGLSRAAIGELTTAILVVALVFARLFAVAPAWRGITANPLDLLRFTGSGQLSPLGGVVGAGLGLLVFTRRRGLPLLAVSPGADAKATAQAVAEVAASLTPQLLARVASIQAFDPTAITLLLTDQRVVRWGSADRSADKARILPTLLAQPGSTFDLTDPDQPFSR